MDWHRLTIRILVSLFCVLALQGGLLATPGDVAQLDVVDRCRTGFDGTLVGDGGVAFRVCPDLHAPDSCHVRITTLHGSPLVEVLADHEAISIRLAGILVDPESQPSVPAQAVIERSMTSPEARVGAELFERLARDGRSPDSAAMLCLALAMPAFEWAAVPRASSGGGGDCGSGCNSTAGGCLGCCGAGCAGTGQTPGFGGCGTACTSSCRSHDQCARAANTNWGPCTQAFAAAAVSLWKCMHRRPSFGCGTVPQPGDPPLPCICCDL